MALPTRIMSSATFEVFTSISTFRSMPICLATSSAPPVNSSPSATFSLSTDSTKANTSSFAMPS